MAEEAAQNCSDPETPAKTALAKVIVDDDIVERYASLSQGHFVHNPFVKIVFCEQEYENVHDLAQAVQNSCDNGTMIKFNDFERLRRSYPAGSWGDEKTQREKVFPGCEGDIDLRSVVDKASEESISGYDGDLTFTTRDAILQLAPKLYEACFISVYSENGDANADGSRVPLRLDVEPEIQTPKTAQDDEVHGHGKKRKAKKQHLNLVKLHKVVNVVAEEDREKECLKAEQTAKVAGFKKEHEVTRRVLLIRVAPAIEHSRGQWLTEEELAKKDLGATAKSPLQSHDHEEDEERAVKRRRVDQMEPEDATLVTETGPGICNTKKLGGKSSHPHGKGKNFQPWKNESLLISNIKFLPDSPADHVQVFGTKIPALSSDAPQDDSKGFIFQLDALARHAQKDEKAVEQLERKLLETEEGWQKWFCNGKLRLESLTLNGGKLRVEKDDDAEMSCGQMGLFDEA